MADTPGITTLLEGLSATEREMAGFLIAGMNTSEIAKRLSLRYHEVAEASKSLRQKLGVSNVDELRQVATRPTCRTDGGC
jgi:DNA-binding CsgD family transcriptional regulator